MSAKLLLQGAVRCPHCTQGRGGVTTPAVGDGDGAGGGDGGGGGGGGQATGRAGGTVRDVEPPEKALHRRRLLWRLRDTFKSHACPELRLNKGRKAAAALLNRWVYRAFETAGSGGVDDGGGGGWTVQRVRVVGADPVIPPAKLSAPLREAMEADICQQFGSMDAGAARRDALGEAVGLAMLGT